MRFSSTCCFRILGIQIVVRQVQIGQWFVGQRTDSHRIGETAVEQETLPKAAPSSIEPALQHRVSDPNICHLLIRSLGLSFESLEHKNKW